MKIVSSTQNTRHNEQGHEMHLISWFYLANHLLYSNFILVHVLDLLKMLAIFFYIDLDIFRHLLQLWEHQHCGLFIW